MKLLRYLIGNAVLFTLAYSPWLPWDFLQITRAARWTHKHILKTAPETPRSLPVVAKPDRLHR